jgi:hypothetical protein
VTAIIQELHQLDDREVIKPIPASTLSEDKKKASLAYLMFPKEKRTGFIKGRGCADGRKQRFHTAKETVSSPTVAIESVFITSVIDAMENRNIATVDVPGAFMQVDMDEIVHMRLEGTMGDLLVRISPATYGPHITIERGKTVIYVLIAKALYGTLKAALLFWEHLTAKLISWGFEPNPYDRCVANKIIDGSQCL